MEVLSKDGSFSISWAKNKKDYDKSMFERLLKYIHFHFNLYIIITFVI
jgi:hypothetical protein